MTTTTNLDKFRSEFPSGAERDVLRSLFFSGPLHDSDIVSKAARSALFERHMVARVNGWNALTALGFERCMACGLDEEKDRRDNRLRNDRPEIRNIDAAPNYDLAPTDPHHGGKVWP